MVLSDEQKIKIILERKEETCKLSNEVLESLMKLTRPDGDKFELTDDENLLARTKLNQIIKNMSIIAGFCDKESQSYVNRVAGIISKVGRLGTFGKINYIDKFVLDKFCTMANTLMIDFNKRPWKLAEFEVGFLDQLKARIRVRK